MQPTQTKEEIRKEAEQRHFHLNQEQLHPTRKKYPKKHQRSLFRTSRADAEIKVRDADERTVDKDREDKTEISADPTTMAIMAACPTGAQAPNLNWRQSLVDQNPVVVKATIQREYDFVSNPTITARANAIKYICDMPA